MNLSTGFPNPKIKKMLGVKVKMKNGSIDLSGPGFKLDFRKISGLGFLDMLAFLLREAGLEVQETPFWNLATGNGFFADLDGAFECVSAVSYYASFLIGVFRVWNSLPVECLIWKDLEVLYLESNINQAILKETIQCLRYNLNKQHLWGFYCPWAKAVASLSYLSRFRQVCIPTERSHFTMVEGCLLCSDEGSRCGSQSAGSPYVQEGEYLAFNNIPCLFRQQLITLSVFYMVEIRLSFGVVIDTEEFIHNVGNSGVLGFSFSSRNLFQHLPSRFCFYYLTPEKFLSDIFESLPMERELLTTGQRAIVSTLLFLHQITRHFSRGGSFVESS